MGEALLNHVVGDGSCLLQHIWFGSSNWVLFFVYEKRRGHTHVVSFHLLDWKLVYCVSLGFVQKILHGIYDLILFFFLDNDNLSHIPIFIYLINLNYFCTQIIVYYICEYYLKSSKFKINPVLFIRSKFYSFNC